MFEKLKIIFLLRTKLFLSRLDTESKCWIEQLLWTSQNISDATKNH